MSILFITQRDPFFVDSFLYEFDKFGIKYSVLNQPNFKRGLLSGVNKAIQLYGPIGFCKLIILRLTSFRKLKLSHCINYSNVRSIALHNCGINLQSFDIICSVSAPSKIDLSYFKPDAKKLNIHCGKLPDYAGMMPIFWQIAAGEHKIIITLHELAKEIDTGRVLSELEMTVGKTLFETSVAAKKQSAHMLLDYINSENSNNHVASADRSAVTLNKFPSKADVKRFASIMRLI